MVFSSFVFLFAFLPLALLCYFAAPAKWKNAVLLVFSLVFYAWGEPVWIAVLLFNVFVGWVGGLLIEQSRGRTRARTVLIVSIACQVLFLFYFKYLGLAVKTVAALASVAIPYRDPGLPIGISFFTFHLISYLVDVYRGEAPALRTYSKLLLYISMFPQLVAGPIIRYADVQSQLSRRTATVAEFSYGVGRFVIGLAKKVILANALSDISPAFLDGNLQNLPLLGAWLGIVLFALHIYFDFSGYSDMAIGLGRMFGFTFKENFDYPYISRSATEFWRRWNISVGAFFRDYVYIPLGGNRRRPWLNLFAVWFLTGLWHGASWNFVVWGLYFGAFIALEKRFLLGALSRLPQWISHLYFIAIVLVGWVFFYFESMRRGGAFLRAMFGLNGAPAINAETLIQLQNHVWLLLVAVIAATPLPKRIHSLLTERGKLSANAFYVHGLVPAAILALLSISAILLVGKTYTPFFYFRF
ncbi:alginate O-acetyltransferase [Gordoniibacillus kamchatkensis]|uniref:Alginate O-acetyltransferase n=1 Tax=Gordoniibacillus kamchatkensis TaxID=1590651 RepID=A0ABR5AMX0_9BACL|nr:MBOAT family O-acyltransferase [Paenibacillus sp. VKM B-2647]KIL42218.1 alginate O-acetyltransferase [Paenibacillus sp. VKM B-2647]